MRYPVSRCSQACPVSAPIHPHGRGVDVWRRSISLLQELESRVMMSAAPEAMAAAAVVQTTPVVSINRLRNGAETDSVPRDGAFVISRSGGDLTQALTVNYVLDPASTAGSGVDFVWPGGSVLIPAGKKSVTVTMPVLNDDVAEARETVQVDLQASLAYTVNSAKTIAVLQIKDFSPTVSIVRSKNASEYNGATTGMGTFTIKRQGGDVSKSLTVHYTVDTSSPLSATAGTDYQALSGVAVIEAGKRSVSVPVAANADLAAEPTETVTALLAADSAYHLNALPARQSATVTVANALSVDFLSATGFNIPSICAYKAVVNGTPGATAKRSIGSEADGFLESMEYSSSGGLVIDTQDRTWASSTDGAMLKSMTDTASGETLTATFSDLQVAPPLLTGIFTDNSEMQLETPSLGVLNGTCHAKTTLLGLTQITVPAGTFWAYQIRVELVFQVSGHFSAGGRDLTVTGSGGDTELYYAVPNVGVAKGHSNLRLALTAPGVAKRSSRQSAAVQLTSYAHLMPEPV